MQHKRRATVSNLGRFRDSFGVTKTVRRTNSHAMFIKVCTATGGSASFPCYPTTTIGDLKSSIHRKWHVHPTDQRLVANGLRLVPDGSPVFEFVSQREGFSHPVYLVPRLPSSFSGLEKRQNSTGES